MEVYECLKTFNRSVKYLTVQDSKQNERRGMTKCQNAKIMYTKELNENLNVCFNCDHHIALPAYRELKQSLMKIVSLNLIRE